MSLPLIEAIRSGELENVSRLLRDARASPSSLVVLLDATSSALLNPRISENWDSGSLKIDSFLRSCLTPPFTAGAVFILETMGLQIDLLQRLSHLSTPLVAQELLAANARDLLLAMLMPCSAFHLDPAPERNVLFCNSAAELVLQSEGTSSALDLLTRFAHSFNSSSVVTRLVAAMPSAGNFFRHLITQLGGDAASMHSLSTLAAYAMHCSVGIRFFNFTNVEMSLRLTGSVLADEVGQSDGTHISAAFLLLSFVRSTPTAIREVLRSHEQLFFEVLSIALRRSDSSFGVAQVLLAICTALVHDEPFDSTPTTRFLQSPDFLNCLGGWMRGRSGEFVSVANCVRLIFPSAIPSRLLYEAEALALKGEAASCEYLTSLYRLLEPSSKSIDLTQAVSVFTGCVANADGTAGIDALHWCLLCLLIGEARIPTLIKRFPPAAVIRLLDTAWRFASSQQSELAASITLQCLHLVSIKESGILYDFAKDVLLRNRACQSCQALKESLGQSSSLLVEHQNHLQDSYAKISEQESLITRLLAENQASSQQVAELKERLDQRQEEIQRAKSALLQFSSQPDDSCPSVELVPLIQQTVDLLQGQISRESSSCSQLRDSLAESSAALSKQSHLVYTQSERLQEREQLLNRIISMISTTLENN